MSNSLVLIGGGHSHAIALRLLGIKAIPGVDLTLITDVLQTPYSGMLPGHVAGFYSYEETHIDLQRLAEFAGAQLRFDRAVGLDLDRNRVICANSPPVAFDYLSVDIGSTPATKSVVGADKYVIPAKPVPQFLASWNSIVDTVTQNPEQSFQIAIVGGGAGGVELAINMQHRLHKILENADRPKSNLQFHLLHSGSQLLPSHHLGVRKRLQKILIDRQICVHLQQKVTEVLVDRLICQSGFTLKCDLAYAEALRGHIIWVTQAAAPDWIEASGLATDNRGFILVKDTLQSLSHPHVFAAGDIATMIDYDRPKAGVFAVRQGKPLSENWRRIINGKPLQNYIPQKVYLALIGTADRSAIASWGKLSWRSPLLWYWKDYLDRQFMGLFRDL